MLYVVYVAIIGCIFFLIRGIGILSSERIDKRIKMRFVPEVAYVEGTIISLPSSLKTLLSPFNFLNSLFLKRRPKIRSALKNQFRSLGVYIRVEEFLSLNEALGIVLLVAYIILVGPSKTNPGLAILILLVGFFGTYLWLRRKHRLRQKAILRLFPDLVDFLSLCVSAGLDLVGSMHRVIAEFDAKEPLIQELTLTLHEMGMGKTHHEALNRMSARLKLLEINSFVKSIIQADRMGTSLLEILQVHSQSIRQRRFTKIERLAIKAPIKLLLPLVIIMFVVLIIVGGPVILQFMRQTPFKGLM